MHAKKWCAIIATALLLILVTWWGGEWGTLSATPAVVGELSAAREATALPEPTLTAIATGPAAAVPPVDHDLAPTATATAAPDRPPTPAARIGDVVGHVRVPQVGIDASVVEVTWRAEIVDGQAVAVWDIPDRAAGHHRGTAPLGGHGNSVISGHISGTDEGVFRGLSDVTPGMEVFATDMDGVEHRYVVEQAVKVLEVGATLEQRQANARYMAPTDDSRITLITCWPNWAYTHRIIVVALLR